MNPRLDWSRAEVEPTKRPSPCPCSTRTDSSRTSSSALAHRNDQEVRGDPWLQIQWMGYREDSIVVRQIEPGAEEAVPTAFEEMLKVATQGAQRELRAYEEKKRSPPAQTSNAQTRPPKDRFRSFGSE
jgi:hypothetical protein